MENIIAIGSIHALYISLLIISKKQKSTDNYILATLMFLMFVAFGIYFISEYFQLKVLQVFIWNISMLIAPVFYLYAYALIQENFKLSRKWIWFLSPYLFSNLYLLYVFVFYTEKEINTLFKEPNIFKEISLFNFFSILELFVVPAIMLLIFLKLRKHEVKVFSLFSNTENRDLKWLKFLAFGMIGIWMIINTSLLFSPENSEEYLIYGFGFSTVFIFYMGYYGIKQSVVFDIPMIIISPKENLLEGKKYGKSELKESEIIDYSERLIPYMETKKPYLDDDLNLYSLADGLNISTHKLSQLLNTNFNQSFYEFINLYRVEEFKRRIQNDHTNNLTILAIALESGFSSKSSFNRVFKSVTGLTPIQYSKTVKKESHPIG
jgi:AraC-like DNA-binding protein